MDGMEQNSDHASHHQDAMHPVGSNCVFSGPTYITIWFAADLLILVSALPLVCRFIYHQCRSKEKQPWYLSAPGFLFVTITMFLLTSDLATIYFYECNHHLWMLSMIIFAVLYTCQIVLLLMILFLRVYFTFKSSPFKLSKLTIICYFILFALSPFVVGCIEFWYHMSHHSEAASLALSLCYSFIIGVMISLLFLFINKLHKLSQITAPIHYTPDPSEVTTTSSTSNLRRSVSVSHMHSDLKQVVSRAVILTGISIACTLSAGIGLLVIDQDTVYGPVIASLLVIVDVYTNLLCILLSYSCFRGVYNKLCGPMDLRCRQVWTASEMISKNVNDQIDGKPEDGIRNTETPTV